MSNLFPGILLGVMIASMVGTGIYFLLRFIESKWRTFPHFVGGSMVGLVLFVLSVVAIDFTNESTTKREELAVFFVIPGIWLLAGGVGAFLHRRSGGSSRDWPGAILLSMLATALNLAIVAYLVHLSTLALWTPRGPITIIAMASSVVYAPLAPLLVWLWDCFRLRRELDAPFRESSIESS